MIFRMPPKKSSDTINNATANASSNLGDLLPACHREATCASPPNFIVFGSGECGELGLGPREKNKSLALLFTHF